MFDAQSMYKFTTGFALAFFTLRLYNHLQIASQVNDQDSQTTDEVPEDQIQLNELQSLTTSENMNIRNASLKILFDRIISQNHLDYVLSGLENNDKEFRRKSLIVIQALSVNNCK
jgi:hypothetical protein